MCACAMHVAIRSPCTCVSLFCKHAVHSRHARADVHAPDLKLERKDRALFCVMHAHPGKLLLISVVCVIVVVEDAEMHTEPFVCRRRKILWENATVVES